MTKKSKKSKKKGKGKENKTLKRCPNGTRRNKTTKNCESTNKRKFHNISINHIIISRTMNKFNLIDFQCFCYHFEHFLVFEHAGPDRASRGCIDNIGRMRRRRGWWSSVPHLQRGNVICAEKARNGNKKD